VPCTELVRFLQLLVLISLGTAAFLYRRKRKLKEIMMVFLNSEFFLVVEVRPQMPVRGFDRPRSVALACALGALGQPNTAHPVATE
jgi:hypothetical protein